MLRTQSHRPRSDSPPLDCDGREIPPGSLDHRLAEFAAALLDPDRPIPVGLIDPDREPSAKRFAIYRNNVVAGLIETLRAAFPAVRRLVGDEFFTAMARIYVSREPPRSPIMLDYGAGFPAFIAAFEPAATLPYLPDVARLERAWVEAYHALEAIPLDAAAFNSIPPDELPDVTLELHPSARIVEASFPAVTIWQMNIDGGVPTPVDFESGGEDALVMRPAAEVEVRVLPVGAAAFIGALAARSPVVVATELAILREPRFCLSDTLAGLINSGALVAWYPARVPPDVTLPHPT